MFSRDVILTQITTIGGLSKFNLSICQATHYASSGYTEYALWGK